MNIIYIILPTVMQWG